MVLKLYFDFLSQPSRAVWLFLKMNDIKFEECQLSLMKSEHKTEEYAKISPMKAVPAIQLDGMPLTESIAILRYLAKKYKVPAHWDPKGDPMKEAKVDEILGWSQSSLRTPETKVFLNLYLYPTVMGTPINWKEVEENRPCVDKAVNVLASYFLKDKKFLCGDLMSIPDLICFCELMQLCGVHEENIYECNDKVKLWFERVKQQINKTHFQVAHKKILDIRENFKKPTKK